MLLDIFRQAVYDLYFIFLLMMSLVKATFIYNIELFNLMFYNPIFHRMPTLKIQYLYAIILRRHLEMQ
jgi:hypothetical protein